jgi:hypothetical protein
MTTYLDDEKTAELKKMLRDIFSLIQSIPEYTEEKFPDFEKLKKHAYWSESKLAIIYGILDDNYEKFKVK